jgi:hypothetical protein
VTPTPFRCCEQTEGSRQSLLILRRTRHTRDLRLQNERSAPASLLQSTTPPRAARHCARRHFGGGVAGQL